MNVYVMNGRYGAYVQLGETPEAPPRNVDRRPRKLPSQSGRSLQAGMTESTDHAGRGDQAAVAAARGGSSSRRQRANHDQLRAVRAIRQTHNDEFRSLESDDDVFNISFDTALALIRSPKQSRRRTAQRKVLSELAQGEDEASRARRPVRSIRDRRHDQRVDSQGRKPGRHHLRRSDTAARGASDAAPSPRDRAPRRRAAALAPPPLALPPGELAPRPPGLPGPEAWVLRPS
jgi:topoisomerase IA-like protein